MISLSDVQSNGIQFKKHYLAFSARSDSKSMNSIVFVLFLLLEYFHCSFSFNLSLSRWKLKFLFRNSKMLRSNQQKKNDVNCSSTPRFWLFVVYELKPLFTINPITVLLLECCPYFSGFVWKWDAHALKIHQPHSMSFLLELKRRSEVLRFGKKSSVRRKPSQNYVCAAAVCSLSKCVCLSVICISVERERECILCCICRILNAGLQFSSSILPFYSLFLSPSRANPMHSTNRLRLICFCLSRFWNVRNASALLVTIRNVYDREFSFQCISSA